MRADTNDIQTAWFEIGRGDPVILIHGLGDDHRAWRRVVGNLALEHRVLLYDFRGHGQSELGSAWALNVCEEAGSLCRHPEFPGGASVLMALVYFAARGMEA